MRLSALLVLSWLLAAWPTPANACSCMPESGDPATALRRARDGADAIFHGRVVSIERGGGFLGLFGKRGLEATLEVIERFKGPVASKLVLPTGNGGACEYPFKVGDEYLVYASEYEGRLVTSLCSRTRPISPGNLELHWLRTGTLPLVPVALQRERVLEAKSRTTGWGPKENLQAAACSWYAPDRALCQLQEALQPLAPGAPASPLLRCTPMPERPGTYQCVVLPGDAAP
ncbi:hypothetical protein ATI61_112215 [Archangium gephyra]|uniref:Ig-like domain-containing protein n=1 Tax=Archangium gephyra TaxID=48 RepID=A0AAC8Q4S3_9BACT|nr:hypothetical protein [Archangium gephyra]AKJ00956.1 Hypothetical protein AA314_02582 [Archangium gephyra]REG26120.1 hypothetical protein ATI61_112215 [Archangium gephyra]